MNDLLFSVHWYLPTLLSVGGIGLFVSGNRRQLPRPRNLGAALIVLALAWAMLSYFVDTDKEKVERGTRQLVADVVNGKWDQFQTASRPPAPPSSRVSRAAAPKRSSSNPPTSRTWKSYRLAP